MNWPDNSRKTTKSVPGFIRAQSGFRDWRWMSLTTILCDREMGDRPTHEGSSSSVNVGPL